MMKERTLTELRNELKGRIYIWLKDEKIGKEFLQNAENEGYHFGKIKPTVSGGSDIIALEKNKQLSYVGFVGHMAFQCNGGSDTNADMFHRIDYSKYVNGDADYYFHRNELPPVTRDIKGKFAENVTVVGDRKEETAHYIETRIQNCNSIDEELELYDEAMDIYDTLVLYDED